MEVLSKNLTLEELQHKLEIITENLDLFFYAVMGMIISLMQIGFGFLEAGSIHQKNATNVMFKNLMDMLICGVVWWLFGYTLAFGDGNSFMGLYYYQAGRWFGEKKKYAEFFFHISYASTSATIVSGAIAGRITFWAYVIYSAVVTGVIFPIVVHWAWAQQGWLYTFGFKDFCGSSAVHLVGGSCAIVAAIILGPRIGRFPKPGTELTPEEKMTFEHHNTLTAGLGGMILISGWFAFNGGSVLHITQEGDGEMVGKIMCNTWLSVCGAVFGVLILFKTGKIDGNARWTYMNSINVAVSAMASICAHADAMDLWAAFVNGIFTSISYSFIKKATGMLKIDDPLDVIAVHFGGGVWGTIGASLLRSDSLVGGYGTQAGIYLGKQIAGTLAIMAWCWMCCIVLFGSMRWIGMLRASPDDELTGADIVKHGEPAYIGIPCNCSYMHKKHDFDPSIAHSSSSPYHMGMPGGMNKIPRVMQTHVEDIEIELQHGMSQRHFSNVAL